MIDENNNNNRKSYIGENINIFFNTAYSFKFEKYSFLFYKVKCNQLNSPTQLNFTNFTLEIITCNCKI